MRYLVESFAFFIENLKFNITLPISNYECLLMKHIITLSLLLSLLLLGTQASAEVVDDNWKNVFDFQTKMAGYGNVKAQYILGEMYEEGRGVKQNYVKAIEWYSKAEKSGHTNAATRISQLKAKIAKEKLAKKLKLKKIKVKVKKSVVVKRSKPVRTVLKKARIKKPITKKVKPATTQTAKATHPAKKVKAITKKETVVPAHKRPAGPSYDINRLKGTSLDNAEDAFE